MKKKIVSSLVVVLLLCACGKGYETIDTNKALELINDGAIIIDVREIDEYNEGHIKGAINIPLDDIDSIIYGTNQTIIVYCATGVRSAKAARKLESKGYSSLYNLDGGLINWGSELED